MIARLDRQESEDGDINVLEAINMIGYSWNKVTQDTIRNCFIVSGLKGLGVNFPLLLKDKEETTNSDLIKTYCEIKKIQPISFDQYLDIDCKEITSAPLSDKDIVEMCQEGSEVDEIREEEVVTTTSPVIDFKTALIYIDSIKHLFNSMNVFDEVFSQAINTIEHLDDIIVQQRLNNEFKQRNLDDFSYKH